LPLLKFQPSYKEEEEEVWHGDSSSLK